MIVLHVITGLHDGGAEAILCRLCRADKSNTHVVVSMTEGGKYGPILQGLGIDVYHLGITNPLSVFTSFLKLVRIIKKVKPDVVQTWLYHADFFGGIAAKISRIKKVCWGVHHTVLTYRNAKLSTILVARFNALISPFIPTKIIYCANAARSVQESIGFNKAKGVVIHNGYDVDLFKPDSIARLKIRESFNIKSSQFLFGNVGRFDYQKDHRNLIDAFDIVRQSVTNSRLLLVGSGLDEDNAEIGSYLQEKRLVDYVLLKGQRSDIPAIMCALDLFVLSSRSEAFPNVLNEAMACGTVCVSTDVGDAAVIVGDSNRVVEPENANSLADAMLKCVEKVKNDRESWTLEEANVRKRIEDFFSIDLMVKNYTNIWSSI